MTDPAIPNAADAIGQGINALVALRPAAISHIDGGKYGNVFTGWRAQQALLLARLSDEVRQSRLPTAFGEGLRQLVASEFDVPTSTDGQAPAVGYLQVTRTPSMAAGTIRRGTRIRRLAAPSVSPPVVEAIYQTTEDVYLLAQTYVANIPMQCTQSGVVGNTPNDDGTSSNPLPLTQRFVFIDPIFDSTIGNNIVGAQMGGGANVTTDDDLRRAARAMSQGRYAPTLSAIVGFALRGFGVRRAAVFEDTVSAITRLVVSDGSRSGGDLWTAQVKQALIDSPAVGFGCRLSVTWAGLVWLNIQATIVLRDSNYQNYTTDISNNVRAALASYFGDRDDFLSFKAAAVRGRIARADPRILTCTSVTITSPSGAPLADTAPWQPGQNPPNAFWTMANNGFQPTYVNPS